MLKLQFKDTPERALWLVGDRIRLGSDESNDVVLSSSAAKDFHAEISIEAHCVVLISEPGSCFVNNLPVDGEYQLAVNDEIRLGTERLLLIDPKQSIKDEDYALLTPANGLNTVTAWELLPAHANLKDRQFIIKSAAVLGRARDCDFSVPYKLLSRQHARFDIQDGDLILEDLASANGCTVNGQRVQRALLKHGDRIAFAKLTFVVKAPAAKRLSDKPSKEVSENAGGQGPTAASKAGPPNTEACSLQGGEVAAPVMAGELTLNKNCSAIDRQLARASGNEAPVEQEQGHTMARPGQHYSRSVYLGACLATCLLVIAWQIIGH